MATLWEGQHQPSWGMGSLCACRWEPLEPPGLERPLTPVGGGWHSGLALSWAPCSWGPTLLASLGRLPHPAGQPLSVPTPCAWPPLCPSARPAAGCLEPDLHSNSCCCGSWRPLSLIPWGGIFGTAEGFYFIFGVDFYSLSDTDGAGGSL